MGGLRHKAQVRSELVGDSGPQAMLPFWEPQHPEIITKLSVTALEPRIEVELRWNRAGHPTVTEFEILQPFLLLVLEFNSEALRSISGIPCLV